MTKILVIYEDARAAAGEFGPHELILGCVGDEVGKRVHELRQHVRGIPMNGVPKVLAALTDADRLRGLAPGGIPILALIDADRIRNHIPQGLRGAADLEAAIRSRFSEPERLTVVLLDRNLETVIVAIGDCDERELVEEALRKDINARDRLLGKLGNDPVRRPIRDCVRKAVPSFDRAVGVVRDALRS